MLRLSIPQQELCSSQTLYSLGQSAKRNLGCAILIAAIEDYQSLDEHLHASARRFLYPVRRSYRTQYDWAVGLTQNINPEWLRDALDSAKKAWDHKRLEAKLRAQLLRHLERHKAKNGEIHCVTLIPEKEAIDNVKELTRLAAHSPQVQEPQTYC